MEKIIEKIFIFPRLIIAIVLGITIFFSLQIPSVQLDNNNMRFLPEGNHARLIANHIDDTFGGRVMILIGLRRPYRSVFEREFLEKILEFSEAVKMIDYVDDVNSIMSTQYITGDDESIIVTNLVPEDFSGTNAEIEELRRRIASWDLYRDALVSSDLSATQILVTLAVRTEDSTSPEVTMSLFRIRSLAREMFNGFADVYITGQTLINLTINESIIADLPLLIPLIVVILLAVLYISFRRLTFVILPLITVIISVVWTVGLAALIGLKFSIITTIMPVLLLAVGSAYGIHVITHYIRDTANDVINHRDLVLKLVRKLVKPVFLAALTTFAGFFSFTFAPIVPIQELGYCASIGVLAAFLIAITFIPSVFLVRGHRILKPLRSEKKGNDRFSIAITSFFLKINEKKVMVLIFTAFAVAVSLYGISKVIIDNVLVEYFRHETDISRSDSFIREFFGGSKELALVFEGDSAEELLDPEVLKVIDDLSAFLSGREEVGKVIGFTDIIKRINQVFNVGESPSGLRPRAAQTFTEDSFGFADFSFGDFGFDEFGNDDIYYSSEPETNENHIDLYTISELLSFLETASGNNPSLSGSDLVRELQRLMNHEGMAYYEIPYDPGRYALNTNDDLQRLVSNYLVLIAGGDNSGYSNDPFEPTAISTTVQLRTTGNNDTGIMLNLINEYISVNFPRNIRVMIGGGAVLEGAVTDLIVNSSIISISISVLIVFFIVAVSNKSLIAGLIGAVPLTLAILSNFAIMGFTGIKLNMGTALVGSLTVGIGIDYTIHLMEFYKLEYWANTNDFLKRTYLGCGKAILINSLSVGIGFWVLMFSRFRIIAELGLLAGFSMFITAFISLTVIPVLLTVIKPKFIYGGMQ
ncbi:MAG: MMPL family transporter [Treponema sp.]|nr:MMPL family transporter [Treponema sp.]